ncbi:MAG: lipoyl(octanoyl) transferase LipB [Chloroflexi bacterium]|nr:lipoyl(octanoyl) transferase LipB [Chloroflexota bacterium]
MIYSQPSSARELRVCRLGRQPYQKVEALQQSLVAQRIAGDIPDTLLLLEHDPVFTLGRRADPAHILVSEEVLARERVAVCCSERGGDVTYHGPGQLVAYPILSLNNLGIGPSDYMHLLEDAGAGVAAGYGLATHRCEGLVGVWIGRNKLAALGVRIRGAVCYHGLALNVDPNMAHWAMIIACGITDGGVTSLAAELGYAPDMAEVQERFCDSLCDIFSMRPTEIPVELLEMSAEGELQ